MEMDSLKVEKENLVTEIVILTGKFFMIPTPRFARLENVGFERLFNLSALHPDIHSPRMDKPSAVEMNSWRLESTKMQADRQFS